jgi:hypothetical protein
MNQTNKIELATLVKQSDDVISADLDGQAVMMHLESYKYFGLDDIATPIWEMIQEPISVAELCNQLLPEYDGQRPPGEQDVLAYLNGLLRKGRVNIVDTK